jgi:type II secretory pathway predicted ATPase ExeA
MTTETIKDVRAHFGLTSIPFTREIVVGHRWSTPLFGEPLTALLGTVEARMSAALIAPSGTGKTLLLRTLRSLLPEARYRVHYIKLTSLSKRDLCREIALACRFDISGNYPIMMRKLQDAFRSQADDEGLRPVVLMDDSHDLRPEVVPMLRVLTNFDMDSRLVVSFILAGNTRLRTVLERSDLECVRRRLAHVATLRLLSRAETTEYIQHRLHIAGATQSPFDSQAVDAVYEITRGNLRAIDHLACKSLELAAHKGVPTVDATLVASARQNLML